MRATMILNRLFGRIPVSTPQRRLYEAIVAQARQPWLYGEAGVPDTPEGRFDMIVLHAVLVIDRLGGESELARDFAQRVFDEMFRDMEASLREMGVGDLSVGRRIKQMAEAFYGRSRAYGQAFEQEDEARRQALAAALSRNVFAGAEAEAATLLAEYVLQVRNKLARQPAAQLLTGDAGFWPAMPS
jgi:cytochrome b pre-mRNA-processing protein 3